MNAKVKFICRNIAKMVIQTFILPMAYEVAKLRHSGEKKLYVFADAHHTSLPFSLEAMYKYVVEMGITPMCHFYDYTHEGALTSLKHAVSFMMILAQAKYVFICDTFTPASSGKKAKGTKIIQLCHFSGPFKKIGYDTPDDVPRYYCGNVFKNYDLVSVSSELYVSKMKSAMRQEEGVVKAFGTSRSDVFYDKTWIQTCREEFYKCYPDAVDKKILFWAPTFRGKAGAPDALDNESMVQLQDKLGDEWLVLIKHHPHDDAMAKDARYRSNCSIPSEKLLPVVDLMITDYSTTVLDFLIFNKPFILYAPDLEYYEKTRGFYVDYQGITTNMTSDAKKLEEMVPRVYNEWMNGNREDIIRCKEIFMSACDGKATERIMKYLSELE